MSPRIKAAYALAAAIASRPHNTDPASVWPPPERDRPARRVRSLEIITDPELRHTTSSQSLCRIRIAHNERRKLQTGEWVDHPQFFDVTIWGAIGEWIARHVAKGDKVVVAGRLRWREWDTETGDKRQAVDITATSIVPAPRSSSAASAAAVATPDEDIPF